MLCERAEFLSESTNRRSVTRYERELLVRRERARTQVVASYTKDTTIDKDRLLFSNAKTSNRRENLTVRVSYDEGKTWTQGKTIYPGKAAYSTLTILANGDIGLLFEKDDYNQNAFVRFTLEWLTQGKDRYEPPK